MLRQLPTFDAACEVIAQVLLAHVRHEQWNSLVLHSPVLGNSLGGTTTVLIDEDGKREDIPVGFAIFDIQKAVLDLRDTLFRTTGQRIWGLTFTLYPSGKFTIEYDYNKPEGYDDSDDPISVAQAKKKLESLGVKVTMEDSQAVVSDFLTEAMSQLQANTSAHEKAWGLGTETRWDLDMNAGELRLSFADGRELHFPVQVIGTYNTANASFMWGWDHPSVPEALRRAARRLYAYGQEQAVSRFTTKIIECSELEAWEFTAAAAQLDGVTGAYRGNAGGTWVYMAFAVH